MSVAFEICTWTRFGPGLCVPRRPSGLRLGTAPRMECPPPLRAPTGPRGPCEAPEPIGLDADVQSGGSQAGHPRSRSSLVILCAEQLTREKELPEASGDTSRSLRAPQTSPRRLPPHVLVGSRRLPRGTVRCPWRGRHTEVPRTVPRFCSPSDFLFWCQQRNVLALARNQTGGLFSTLTAGDRAQVSSGV